VCSSAKVGAALRDWLDTLQPDGSLLAHLVAHIEKLRYDRDWSQAEVDDFEGIAGHILARLAGGDSSGSSNAGDDA